MAPKTAPDPGAQFGEKILHISPTEVWRGRDPKRLRDDASWRRFARGRLSAEEVRRLEKLFTLTDAACAAGAKGRPEWRWTVALRDWILDVLEIDVEIKRSGRAVLRPPTPTPGSTTYAPYRVELQWLYDRASDSLRFVSAHVIADQYLDSFFEPIVIGTKYFAAFELAHRRSRTSVSGVPRRRPKPGTPLDPDFYRRLLAAYDTLLSEGHRDPAAEIARRMDANHSTVKSWLRRGRLYLEEGGKR